MTLKEKIEQEKIYINPYNFKLTKEGVENFEKIVDDFAIKFAKWCDENVYEGDSYIKALEIFKKEIEKL